MNIKTILQVDTDEQEIIDNMYWLLEHHQFCSKDDNITEVINNLYHWMSRLYDFIEN